MSRHSGTPTFVVAASNAGPESLDRADYECSGANDEVEINLAIVAANAIGGTVELTEGTFTTAASIVMKSNVTLSGAGMGRTIITQPNGANIDHIIDDGDAVCTDVAVKDLTIDGNQDNNGPVTGIQIGSIAFNAARVRFECLEILEMDTAGLQGDYVTDYWVIDCRMVDGECIRGSHCENVVVRGCISIDSDGCGIVIGSSQRVAIEGNVIIDSGRGGTGAGIDVGGSHHVTVAGNVIEVTGAPINAAIWTQGPVVDVAIIGNVAFGAQRLVAWGFDAGAPRNISIVGNTGRGLTTGLVLYSGSDVLVADNTLLDIAQSAINVRTDNTDPTRFTIRGNHIYNVNTDAAAVDGFDLQDLTYSTIEGNTIDTVGLNRWAINGRSATGSDYNVYKNNRFLNIGKPESIVAIGSHDVVCGNIADEPVVGDPVDGAAILPGSGEIALVTVGGGEARSLADPLHLGDELYLYFDTDAGDCVVTAASDITQVGGENVMTFDTVGEHILLRAISIAGALKWRVIVNEGVVLS